MLFRICYFVSLIIYLLFMFIIYSIKLNQIITLFELNRNVYHNFFYVLISHYFCITKLFLIAFKFMQIEIKGLFISLMIISVDYFLETYLS